MTDLATRIEAPVVAKLYDQEGNLVPFVMKPGKLQEQFREWLARHDRYTHTENNNG